MCNYCYGLCEYRVLDGNVQTIGPMDTAVFIIEVTNCDYSKTLHFDIDSVPDGWSAFINHEILITANSPKALSLYIIPPREFGFHYETATFRVIVNEENSIPIYLDFMVKSCGFSTIGFEPILLLIIIIGCIFIISYSLLKKKSSIKPKNKSKIF